MDKRTIKKLELERIELSKEQQVLFDTELSYAYKTPFIQDWYIIEDDKYFLSYPKNPLRICLIENGNIVYRNGMAFESILLNMPKEQLIQYIELGIEDMKKIAKRNPLTNSEFEQLVKESSTGRVMPYESMFELSPVNK